MSRGHLVRDAGLQAVQELRRALRIGCSGEDRAPVVLQYFDPGRDVGSVIAAKLGRQVKIGRKEC